MLSSSNPSSFPLSSWYVLKWEFPVTAALCSEKKKKRKILFQRFPLVYWYLFFTNICKEKNTVASKTKSMLLTSSLWKSAWNTLRSLKKPQPPIVTEPRAKKFKITAWLVLLKLCWVTGQFQEALTESTGHLHSSPTHLAICFLVNQKGLC